MALLAQDSKSRHYPHRTDNTLTDQVKNMARTIDELTTRFNRLKGISPPTNTAISHSDTSRTRESNRTNTSALTDSTDRSTPVTYIRQHHSRHAVTNHSSRARIRSPSDSPRYRSPPHWESPPPSNPTDDYSATTIMPDNILLWSK